MARKLRLRGAGKVSAPTKTTKVKDAVRSTPRSTHLDGDIVRSSPKTSHKKPRKDMSKNLGSYLHKSKLPTGAKIGVLKKSKQTKGY
jgi:hypothetical protein